MRKSSVLGISALVMCVLVIAGCDASSEDPLNREARPLEDPLHREARQGDAQAQYELALRYREGDGVEQSDIRAAEWAQKAAEQGHARAQNSLGLMYSHGRGVARDDSEAVRWWRLAAEQGLAQAQANLGWRYHEGRGVAKDDVEALRWLQLAAEQGNNVAKSNMRIVERRSGIVVERRIREASYAFQLDEYGCPTASTSGVPTPQRTVMQVFLWAEERGRHVLEAHGQCHECYMGLARRANDQGIVGLRAQQVWRDSPMPRLCDAMRDYYLDNPRLWDGRW